MMKLKNKKITLLSIPILLILTLIIFTSCKAIKIADQPSLMTVPVNKKGEILKPKHKIDFEKDDPKMIIEKAWKNMYYAPFVLVRQLGDVKTISAGTTVIQSVSTYRLSDRKNEEGVTDSGKPGLKQDVNYMQSYSVTAQGLPGIDIRLMIEALRKSSGEYVSRIAKDKTNIKLNPETGDFYNLTGQWQAQQGLKTLNAFNAHNKDDPNSIISYDISAESINSAKPLPNNFKAEPYSKKKNATEYANLAAQIEAKQIPNVYVYEISFNKKAWEGTYLKIMKDMLELGGQTGTIDYKYLKMTMEIWENGFIRQMTFQENYQIDLGSLKANATLDSNIQISYKNIQKLTENGKPINWTRKFLKRTKKNFKDNRKPPATVDQSKLK